MKNVLFSIIILFVLGYSSCDVVDEPYWENFKDPNDTIPTDTNTVIQKVLLEDFTGHDCVACPTAALLAEEMKEDYGSGLIVMAVHAGWFARPIEQVPSLNDDFRNPAGEAWYGFFNITTNPIGLINRVEKSGGIYTWGDSEWEDEVGNQLQNDPQASMEIENNFNESTRVLETTITTQFIDEQADQFSLIVCVTQDSIISGQKNGNEEIGPELIEDYVFMHMLRGSLNGNWGELLTEDDPVVVEKDYVNKITYTFPEDWIPKDCHIVAFIYSQENYTILQAEEASVLE